MIEEKKIKEIQEELTDLVDEYFPKIEPIKGNKGRGEALVIVATAINKFKDLLAQAREEGRVEGIIKGIKKLEKTIKKKYPEIEFSAGLKIKKGLYENKT
jgi:hypothetical protein